MIVLTNLLKKSIDLASMIVRDPKFTDMTLSLIGWIPNLIRQVDEIGNLGDLETALGWVDNCMVVDENALDFVHDLPADQEELLLDHLSEVLLILAYNKLKVQGYYVEPESDPS